LILLMIASGASGVLLGRFFPAYALVPTTFLIIAPAWYLGVEQGFVIGMLAFVVSAVVMQVSYFASAMTYLVIENLSLIDQVQSEASPPLPEF
jgi:hypothetical protein